MFYFPLSLRIRGGTVRTEILNKKHCAREWVRYVPYGKGKKQAVVQTIETKMCDNIRQYTIRGDNLTPRLYGTRGTEAQKKDLDPNQHLNDWLWLGKNYF